jgi:hypothetical protein
MSGTVASVYFPIVREVGDAEPDWNEQGNVSRAHR